MTTNKSKVLAYLPKQTYERLVLFQREHGLSLSQAVSLVVEDYFGLCQEPLRESVSDRLTRLEDAVAKLTDLPINSPSKSKGNTNSANEPINAVNAAPRENLQENVDPNIKLLDDSLIKVDSLPVQLTASATIVLPDGKQNSQGKQQVDQLVSRSEWNVYLHHQRGTVEQIAGPFSDEEQAKSEMYTQMEFGLFPEFKGYKWECREN